jgi:hypothetical protein
MDPVALNVHFKLTDLALTGKRRFGTCTEPKEVVERMGQFTRDESAASADSVHVAVVRSLAPSPIPGTDCLGAR